MSESSIDKSINLGALSEALNDKMDRDGLNADIKPAAGYGVDYVVEWKTPTASDPSWYRKYASGWVEQGRQTAVIQIGTIQTVNLLIRMANTNYQINLTMWRVNTDDTQFLPASNYSSITATSFTLLNTRYTGSGTDTYCTKWEVKGMAA